MFILELGSLEILQIDKQTTLQSYLILAILFSLFKVQYFKKCIHKVIKLLRVQWQSSEVSFKKIDDLREIGMLW